MFEFVSTVIAGAFISMGIGAIITLVAMVTGVEIRASHAFLAMWREQMGFTRVEFIERTVDEITGIQPEKDVPTSTAEFGPAAGCLTILIFIPWHLLVTPVAYIVLLRRKAHLRRRLRALPPEKRALVDPQYLRWAL